MPSRTLSKDEQPANQQSDILSEDEDCEMGSDDDTVSVESNEDMLPPAESSHTHPQVDFERRMSRKMPSMRPEAAARPEAKAPRLEALEAPRWLASSMIVAFHFYNPGYDQETGEVTTKYPIHLGRFAMMGGHWTQFFFVLSGFVLSYVEMARPSNKGGRQLSQLQYLRKRLLTIYPTYMIVLVITIFQNAPALPDGLFSWAVLPLHITLMQAWIPIVVGTQCCGQSWVTVAWFMSALVVYWLLLRPLSNCFRRASFRTCVLVIVFCMVYALFPGAIWQHYSHVEPDAWITQFTWCALKNNPIGYINVFVAGIAAARIFILTCCVDAETNEKPSDKTQTLKLSPDTAPWIFKVGVILGYAAYALLVIFFPKDQPWYLAIHNGGLIPIMLLVLIGGALGYDPIARYIFTWTPLKILGRISYSQYLMQYNVFAMLEKVIPDKLVVQILFPFALVATAYLMERFVARVYTEWQLLRAKEGTKGCDEKLIDRCDRCFARCC